MATVKHTITAQGMDQESLVAVLTNLIAVVNELQADHASYKTVVDELVDDHAVNKTALDTLLAKLDLDAGITDTDYAASVTVTPTLTASKVATLTNSTAVSLSEG